MLNKILIAVLLIIPFSSHAGETSLSSLIDDTYDFHPHELSNKEQAVKSKSLDEFWNKVKSNEDEYLPMLREELNGTDHYPFFYFNAGLLLLSSSELESDRNNFLKNISKANLADIDNTFYLRIIFDLGKRGFDTSEAALHLLSYPDFKVFIPEHALSLGAGWSLNVLLAPLKEDLFLKKLIEKIRIDKNDPQNIHLVYALWYSDSPEALLALKDISEDFAYLKNVHTTAKKLIEIDDRILEDLTDKSTDEMYESVGLAPDLTYSELKDMRQKRFTSISDESLGRFKTINSLMKRKRISLQKYKSR